MIVVIVNHNHNANAIALKQSFERCGKTFLIDSGSSFSDDKDAFDQTYPNIYYAGLYNRALRLVRENNAEALLFITSDVEIDDPSGLYADTLRQLADPKVGVCSPKSAGNHPWSGSNARVIPFAEGYCFAAKAAVLDRLGRVDLEINQLGWGIDIATGFMTSLLGMEVVQFESSRISHSGTTGYDVEEASVQMRSYLNQQGVSGRYLELGRRVYKGGADASRIWKWITRYYRCAFQLRNWIGTQNKTLPFMILDWIPLCSEVLDIGCGDGSKSKLLNTLRAETIVGVEPNAQAAEMASTRIEKVVSNLSELDPAEKYDVALLLDVIEHQANPEFILDSVFEKLKPEGFCIASVPNIGHWSARLKIFFGSFEYENLGIFDRTHLRFYTFDSIKRLLQSKYEIIEIRQEHGAWMPCYNKLPRPVRDLFLSLAVPLMPRLFASQFVFRFQRKPEIPSS